MVDRDDQGSDAEADAELLAPAERFPQDAWDLLAPMLTPARRERMLQVVAGRTERVRLVIQDIHHPHNVSACLRSADAFGVQDVDVVTMRERFRASRVARGVAAWLTVHRHEAVAECAAALKRGGYRVFAGVPRPDARPLGELPLDQPIAVVFGNEHDGVDRAWDAHIDYAFTIPMVGMVESLNISVCAAITLHQLTAAVRSTVPAADAALSAARRQALLNAWVCRQFNSWPTLLERLRGEKAKSLSQT